MARPASSTSGNLPLPVTRFIGRRRELLQVHRRLQEARLVTLTGVGGVGKTRLAVEVATAARRAFRGGVWMVDLAHVPDGGRVPQAVATALGVVDRSTRRPSDKIVDHLGALDALLVLDNCEHVIAGCAEFVAEVLARTPAVKVLATSRQTLGIGGEHLFAVPPLWVPDDARARTAATLRQCDAVQLLADRAQALQPGFALTESNLIAAGRLCARLDGLPLAIELAVTRLRTLTLEQVLDRLEGTFTLLSLSGTVARPSGGSRQRTLQAVMDWSYSLCSAADRLLWARLSVFTGGFDLAAAEAVCSGDGLEREAVLDVLDRLVAQSIVLPEVPPDAGVGGMRFRLLETIRQYGRDRLVERGEQEALRLHHRDHYLRVAESVAAQWCTPYQEAGLARLRTDHGNLRAALETSLTDPGSARAALALTSALRHHWCADAFLGEARTWLDQALARPTSQTSTGDQTSTDDQTSTGEERARVEALWVAAWVCLLQGDLAAGLGRLDECDALARRLGDERSAGFARSLRGTAWLFQGELAEAIDAFEACLAVFDRIGETEGPLWAMFQLAIALAHQGDDQRAQAVCRESIARSEATGERLCRSYALWVRSFDTWRQGDLEQAGRWAREGLAIQRAFNDPVGVALMIELLSWIAASAGDLAGAARLRSTADSVWALIGTTLAAFGPPLLTHRTACQALLRAGLDGAVARLERARGEHSTVEAAIASILDCDAAGRPEPPGPVGAGPEGAGPVGTDGPSGSAAPSPLSSREREVVALLADGLSNREIAARLVISKRTVDGHLERIFGKLGVSSRAQVAAWAARSGVSGGGYLTLPLPAPRK